MRKATVAPNYAVRDALLALQAKGSDKAKSLIIEAKASVEERTVRFQELMGLLKVARIQTWAPAGYTSRAERVARELAYLGGEEYAEGVRVLKFAGNSRADWQNAVACFGRPQQVKA